jgi:hypothetical protein
MKATKPKASNSKKKRGRPSTGKVLVGFKLPPQTIRRLERAAKMAGVAKSVWVERALELSFVSKLSDFPYQCERPNRRGRCR